MSTPTLSEDSAATTEAAPSGTPETAWQCPHRDHLLIERFDDEYILYHKLSGETHVLNREAKYILDLIAGHPWTAAAIADRMAQAMPEASGCDRRTIERHLRFLEQWGLAVRSRPSLSQR